MAGLLDFQVLVILVFRQIDWNTVLVILKNIGWMSEWGNTTLHPTSTNFLTLSCVHSCL